MKREMLVASCAFGGGTQESNVVERLVLGDKQSVPRAGKKGCGHVER